MPAQVSPRRVITVDDSGMVTRAPTPPRRAVPPRPVVAPVRPNPQLVIPINDEGRNVYVPNYAARGNAVAVTTGLIEAALPSTNTGAAHSKYRMSAFESQTYQTFREVGADEKYLFAGQRAVWEDDDSKYGTQSQGGRNNPDRQYLRSGQRAVWEDDTSETGNSIRGSRNSPDSLYLRPGQRVVWEGTSDSGVTKTSTPTVGRNKSVTQEIIETLTPAPTPNPCDGGIPITVENFPAFFEATHTIARLQSNIYLQGFRLPSGRELLEFMLSSGMNLVAIHNENCFPGALGWYDETSNTLNIKIPALETMESLLGFLIMHETAHAYLGAQCELFQGGTTSMEEILADWIAMPLGDPRRVVANAWIPFDRYAILRFYDTEQGMQRYPLWPHDYETRYQDCGLPPLYTRSVP